MGSKLKLANISDKTSSLACHMFPWQQLDLSNRQNFFKYGWSFQDHANSRQQRIGVTFSANSIAHMLRIIKRDVSKKEHVFHAPDNLSNTEYNVDVINNVMTFLTSRFKVKTVYSFKTSYFH